MSEPIQILYIDDSALDRALVRDALEEEHGGFQVIEAASRQEFEGRLTQGEYDLVLSDYSILGFEGLAVIDAVRARDPGLPVVIVTGTGSEEIAVEAMKRGADDYVIKSPAHIRLLPRIIHTVLEKKRLEAERSQALEALWESEERFRQIAETIRDVFYVYDPVADRFLYTSPAYEELWQEPVQKVYDDPLSFTYAVDPRDKEAFLKAVRREREEGDYLNLEYRIVRPDGTLRWVWSRNYPILDEMGVERRVVGITENVTQRKQAEEELRGSKEQLAVDLEAMTALHRIGTLFVGESSLQEVLDQIIQEAIAVTRAAMGTIQLLDPASGNLKIVAQQGFTQPWLDFWSEVAQGQGTCGTALERRERIIVEDVNTSPIFVGTPALEVQRQAGVRAIQSTPLVGRSGEVLGIISTHFGVPHRPDESTLRLLDLLVRQTTDIIERVQAERALRESESKFRTLVDQAPQALFLHDMAGRIVDVNQATVERYGYTREQLLQMQAHDIDADYTKRENQGAFWQKLREQKQLRFEASHRRQDGSTFPVQISLSAIDLGGDTHILALADDISERKRSEEELQRLCEQTRQDAETKATLLREVHHRVKNNLQIISSLLDLQSDQVQDAPVIHALQNSRHRVRTMALVHESLYQGPDLAHLDLGQYMRDLVVYLMDAYEGLTVAIDLDVQAEPISLDLDRAIPCGLIVTELVSNALEHAFPHGQAGMIQIALHDHQGQVVLAVRDDGIGLPAEVDALDAPTLGLRIVHLLTQQLKGTLSVNGTAGRGTAFTVTFPVSAEQKPSHGAQLLSGRKE